MAMSCSVGECAAAAVARGMCGRHYSRFKKYGDPLVRKTIPRRRMFDSDEEWFWAAVAPQGECRVWTGAKHRDGYGRVVFRGREKLAHVYAMELRIGSPIPAGLQVNHECDIPPCVIHTYLGTQQQNIRDMDSRNRRANRPGQESPRAKLTAAEVSEIRAVGGTWANRGAESQKDLARRFRVSQATISSIILRKSWK